MKVNEAVSKTAHNEEWAFDTLFQNHGVVHQYHYQDLRYQSAEKKHEKKN